MRLTDKDKIKELETLQNNNVLMTDNNYKELKLGKLENIEDELGIELITLFKAQTQGFYIINVLNEIEKVKLSEWRFNLIKKEVHRIKWNKHLSFTDYGKTWALTKEELKNDN